MIVPAAPWLPLPAEARTLPRMLALQAERFAGATLFSCGGETWRYDDVVGIAARMAGVLAAAGIAAGDRVAILAPNRPEVMRVVLGCGWRGAIAVPLNTAVKTRQLRYYLGNSGARVLVADATLLATLDAGALDDLPLERVLSLDPVMRADLGRPIELFASHAAPIDPHPVTPGHPLAILYTSGTTGEPKGVLCPHAQFHWWGALTAHFLELKPRDVLATTLPLFHTNALNTFFQALLTGGTQVVLPRFSASRYWQDMTDSGSTVGYLLGAMIPMLLAQPVSDFERRHGLRVVLGPGVPAAMHERLFERAGVRLVDGFGSTETNFVIGATAGTRQAGRIGWTAPGIAARVVNADDTPVADGTAGELILRADEPYAFAAGYHGKAEATVEAWRNQWVHTGDRVIRHDDGSFAFIDRIKDVIRRRGENISSFEVEQVIAAIAEIEAVAVYPVPSDLAEDEVMAAVVLKPGAALTASALIAICERELPRHAVPRYVAFMADLPRTENGKIQKFKLREAGIAPATYDRQTAARAV